MKRSAVSLATCSLLLIVCAVVCLCVGAVPISLSDILSLLFDSASSSMTATDQSILVQLRLPRIVSACLVGASLGVAGVGFRGLFRNPLADPYVIGASSGAGLGVTLAITMGLQAGFFGFGGIALAALIGSILAVAIVFAIVAPSELPVAIITALLGCPLFLLMLKALNTIGGVQG